MKSLLLMLLFKRKKFVCLLLRVILSMLVCSFLFLFFFVFYFRSLFCCWFIIFLHNPFHFSFFFFSVCCGSFFCWSIFQVFILFVGKPFNSKRIVKNRKQQSMKHKPRQKLLFRSLFIIIFFGHFIYFYLKYQFLILMFPRKEKGTD
jgi:hypothetical protein